MVARVAIPGLRFQGAAFEQLLLPFMEGRFHEMADEYLLEGPTGTGKSVLIAALYKYAMRKYPGANLLVMRKVKADLGGSFMQMWENEVLDWEDPWDRWMLTNGTGGQIPSHRSRDVYKYPNGSRLWCRGMDQWPRVKSMAFDLAWPMEMTEFEEEQIEGLMTRLRARRGVFFPKRMLIGDVNPEFPQHWANQRALAGVSRRIKTTLRDNPGYYDVARQQFTESGNDYLDRIKSQIRDSARRARYIEGQWCSATGQILEWDEARNMFDGKVVGRPGQPWRIEMERTHPVLGNFVEINRFGASYDWGSAHAGTLQVWGVDDAGRQYLVEEVYHSKQPVQWWAEWAVKLWKKYDLAFIVCDSAAKDSIAVFNQRLRESGAVQPIALPCAKRQGTRQESNMEVLQDIFCEQRDGAPGVFVRRNALAHAPDSKLKVQCFAEEIPAYVYAEHDPSRRSGRSEDRPDRKCVDDGLDACTYFRVHMVGGRKMHKKFAPLPKVQSHEEKWRKSYWEAHAG